MSLSGKTGASWAGHQTITRPHRDRPEKPAYAFALTPVVSSRVSREMWTEAKAHREKANQHVISSVTLIWRPLEQIPCCDVIYVIM